MTTEETTIDLTPIAKKIDTNHTQIQIWVKETQSWENFCAGDEWCPIADTITLFRQWDYLPSPLKIVTQQGDTLCRNSAAYKLI